MHHGSMTEPMTVLDVLPPSVAATTGPNQKRKTQSHDMIMSARDDHPGKWCLIATYNHRASSHHAATKTFPNRYEGEPVEFAARTIDEVNGVYVRWMEGDE